MGAADGDANENGHGGEGGEEVELKLEGSDLLELTSFVQKKVWIDSKIKFLSSLDPISVFSPLPPLRTPTTKPELKEWWLQHDRIEAEVDAYDMGDLKRLKEFAKETSKRNLSPKDTDLIEITLTTLFALDKLLALLRQRRRNLNLLKYRLQWEEHLGVSWSTHSKILDVELPKFLNSARWTVPETASPHPPSPLSLTSSLPASTSANSLSTLSHSSSSHSLRTSQSTSIRHSLLSLSLYALKTSLNTVSSTQIPTTSAALDKLIDGSNHPIPDEFIDEMERLEKDVGDLDGLIQFGETVEENWKEVERVWNALGEVKENIEGVERKRKEASEMLPNREKLGELQKGFEDAKRSLDKIRKRQRLKRIVHRLIPGQEMETDRLERLLRDEEERTILLLEQLRLALSHYRLSLEELEKANKVKEELQNIITIFRAFLHSTSAEDLQRVTLSDAVTFVLERNSAEDILEKTWDDLEGNVKRHVGSVPLLRQHAATSIVSLGKYGVDPNVARVLRELNGTVEEEKKKVDGAVKEEGERREALGEVRRWRTALKEVERKGKEVQKELRNEMEVARWKETMCAVEVKEDIDIDAISTQLSSAHPSTLQSLLSRHPKLYSHLLSLHANLATTFSALPSSKTLLDDIRKQTTAVLTFDTQSSTFGAHLDALRAHIVQECGKETTTWTEEEVSATRLRLAALERTFDDELRSTIHSHITFLASSSSASLSPFDLDQHDAAVREHVNTRLATKGGQLDAVRKNLEELEHLRGARKWDEEKDGVEKKVRGMEEQIESAKKSFVERAQEEDSGFFETLLQQLDSHATALGTHSAPLTSLATSLAALIAAPLSTSPLFTSHVTRQNDHTALLERHASTSESLDKLRAAIQRAHADRRMLEERRALAARAAQELTTSCRTISVALENLANDFKNAERPSLDDESCFVPSPQEAVHEERFEGMSKSLEEVIKRCDGIQGRSLEVNTMLAESGSDPAIGQELNASLDGVRASVAHAQEAMDAADKQRRLLNAVRSAHIELEEHLREALSAKTKLVAAIEMARWTDSGSVDSNVEISQQELDTSLDQLAERELGPDLMSTIALLQPSHLLLHARLQDFVDTVRRTEKATLALRHLLAKTHEQRKAVQHVLSEARQLINGIEGATKTVTTTVGPDSAERTAQELEKSEVALRTSYTDFDARALQLRSDEQSASHFLGQQPAASPKILEAQDSEVASVLSSALDTVEDRLGELSSHLDIFSHYRQAMAWDRELVRVKLEAEHIEGQVDEVASALTSNATTDAATLYEDLGSRLNLAAEALAHVQVLATSLHSTLTTLKSSPQCSEPLFSDHAPRKELLVKLECRIAELANRVAHTKAAIAEASRLLALAAAREPEFEEKRQINGNADLNQEKVRDTGERSEDTRSLSPPMGTLPLPLTFSREASSRVAFTSSEDVEDVFGPTIHSAPFPFGDDNDSSSASLADVRARLDAITVEHWLDDLSFLPLPTSDDAEIAARQLAHVATDLDSLQAGLVDHSESLTSSMASLRSDLNHNRTIVERVTSLADFNRHIEAADEALSDLLSSIDAATPEIDAVRPSTPTPSSTKPVSGSLRQATEMVTEARKAAVLLIDDGRVEANVLRLEETLSEMVDMIDDLNSGTSPVSATANDLSRPPSSRSTTSSSSSLRVPSSQSMSHPTSRQSGSRQSIRTISSQQPRPITPSTSARAETPRKQIIPKGESLRTPRARVTSTPTSTRGATLPKAFNFTSRTRSVSSRPPVEQTRAPLSTDRLASRRTSSSTTPGDQLRSSASSRLSFSSSVSDRRVSGSSRRDSLASSTSSLRSTFSTPIRDQFSPMSVLKKRQSPRISPPVRRFYKANKKRKVDVEVGRIVNQIPLSVHVRAAEQHDHKDESGMYWIGERLYFVRILRSKTAMVRVGGGWQNLSTFLLTHFSDTESIQSLKISPSTSKTTATRGQDPTWITSATLSASTSSSLASSTRSRHSLSRTLPLSAKPPMSSTENVATPRVQRVWRP